MDNFLIYVPKKEEKPQQQELQLEMPLIIIPKLEEKAEEEIIIELF